MLISINNEVIPYARECNILGLSLNGSGLIPFLKDKVAKANRSLLQLKRFSGLETRTELHFYKALVEPYLDYPPIPTNCFHKTNFQKL